MRAQEPVVVASSSTEVASDVIVISDYSDDDARTTTPSRKKVLVRYRTGSFICDDIDLERVVSRTGWLSGEGLAVFVEGRRQACGLQDVSVVHPRTLRDVQLYQDALLDGDGDGEGERAAVTRALAEVQYGFSVLLRDSRIHS